MNDITIIVSIIGIIGTISSIYFAYLAIKRNNKLDDKKEGKNEGVLISDLGYIKSTIDRMEKKLDLIEERYYELLNRLVKIEEKCLNNEKNISELFAKNHILKKGVK